MLFWKYALPLLVLQSCHSVATKNFVAHRDLAVTIRDTTDELLRDTLSVDSESYTKKLKEQFLKGDVSMLSSLQAASLDSDATSPPFLTAEKNVLALYKLNDQFVKHAELLLKIASYDSSETIAERSLETSEALDEISLALGKEGVGNKAALISGGASSLFKLYLQDKQKDTLSEAIAANLPLVKDHSERAKQLLPIINGKQVASYDKRFVARNMEVMRLIREIEALQNVKDRRAYEPVFSAIAEGFVQDAKTYKLVTKKRHQLLEKAYAKLPSSYAALAKSVNGGDDFKTRVKTIVDEVQFARNIYSLNEKSLEYRKSARLTKELVQSKSKVDAQIKSLESQLRLIDIRLTSLDADSDAAKQLTSEKEDLEQQLDRLKKISEHLGILQSDAKAQSDLLKSELEEAKK